MTYFFDASDFAFSGSPTLSTSRDGLNFYIAAADSGSYECGALDGLDPIATHQDLTAEAAAELLSRLYGLPRVTDGDLQKLKDAAVEFWG